MTNPSPSVDLRAPTREGVLRAADKIAALLPQTPVMPLDLPNGDTVWCKVESLQPVGAFKIRGAWHRLSDLTEAERAMGVVAVSSGNHAQGVAWAARRLGIAAKIVMPNDAPAVKLAATRALGAEVVLYDRPGGEDRDDVARRLTSESGATLVHAYGDPWVIEGQGSCGVELAAQMECLAGGLPSRVFTPCGGGGLAAGLALALPEAEIVPVEPEGWDDVARSLASGTIQRVATGAPKTACDALQTPATFPINFAVMTSRGMQGIAVSEAEVRAAQRYAFSHLRLVIEPGGAAALAAILGGKVASDGRTAVILSGGNVDPAAFAAVISEA
ncbi:MAG: pyridoxal-5'-phosphate-dependent protein [Novosphingobium sp. 28-62-57]|uniref:threonine ammonia-lyase n=1 Tax=unclassified Novosphingobium TaxID=2644732 RepID=UPI000BD716D7|nr:MULTISPECIES: pyridoxal-phosphate dependent enzyme [unclassified Novosphingobium]OYW49772.1 MAG: pyridoxal-5'-phosphate-dependent protein [Novosphingobium sp. 12-62-10]OYZ12272.1 MAG: pyridoxal-5'-phosphate-dependent protein [Novosphingobium sp. 28-62-57]OZA34355.1 MAG: pyridoxal-5'-phosphate-dependent protein [Novosphingobium sp. 17-62-9]HQS70829.1 pyridoxal-phosphate dependent enzyme [Novosphingobium sp.]